VADRDASSTAAAGAATDAFGRAVLDPTKNVLDLVDAAIRRQDDLREAEAKHLRELLTLRAEHDRDLRMLESSRIDAIRAVDVGAVQRAAETQATAAATLAAASAQQAETLRTQVATTATQAQQQLTAALDPIQKDIADLRRAQYEAQGVKSNVVESTGSHRSQTTVTVALVAIAVAFLSSTFLGLLSIAVAVTLHFVK